MKSLIATLAFSFVLVSASSLAQAQDKTPNYFPMKAGNQWAYQVDSGNGVKVEITNKVAEIEEIDGESLARIETFAQGRLAATEHLSQNEKGLFRNRFGGGKIDPPIQLIKFPIKKGDKWSMDTSIAGQKLSVTANVDQADVTVPAGKYSAVKVVVDAKQGVNNISTTYWFAENVGIVKQTVSVGGNTIAIELSKFTESK